MDVCWKIQFGQPSGEKISEGLWGQNFEITRKTLFGGIGAQLINNRKFFADDMDEFARGWTPVGKCRMIQSKDRRVPEVQLGTEISGVIQESDLLKLQPNTIYRWRLRLKGYFNTQIKVSLGCAVAVAQCSSAGEAIVIEGTLSTHTNDGPERFSLLFTGDGSVLLENVSVLPDDAVLCGLRPDVISQLRATHPYSLRFPGGCYAEFYDWKQGLLEQDDRNVISVKGMNFLLGPTLHQDPVDMSLDDFISVCRMVGAQPQYTVKMTDSTPEDVAALVEYANGSAQTRWGAVRAARGHVEPYGIRRWYVGNEIYPFVPGMKDPVLAAAKTVELARAMKKVDPSIELVPSTWALKEWNATFMAEIDRLGGTELFSSASYHQYLLDIMRDYGEVLVVESPLDPTSAELVESCLRAPMERILPRMQAVREGMKDAGSNWEKLPITMDEWNYYWGRVGHPILALFMAGLFNVFIRHSAEIGITEALFFHPINEGMIGVTPEGAVLEDGAKAWKMAQHHSGKELLPIINPQPEHPVDAAASVDGNSYCITLVNRSLNQESSVSIPDLSEAKTVLTECWKMVSIEDCFRANSMRIHTLTVDENGTVLLPPASMASICFEKVATK